LWFRLSVVTSTSICTFPRDFRCFKALRLSARLCGRLEAAAVLLASVLLVTDSNMLLASVLVLVLVLVSVFAVLATVLGLIELESVVFAVVLFPSVVLVRLAACACACAAALTTIALV
jgi:hypothetical protein